jgi:hypothetical protein
MTASGYVEPVDADTGAVDPYDRDENVFRTDGRDACHWCYLRPQAWVWGPYGTRVCDHCQQMIAEGRAQDVVEEMAARMTVRDGWGSMLDPEDWREREHNLMDRWLEVRTDCRPIHPAES